VTFLTHTASCTKPHHSKNPFGKQPDRHWWYHRERRLQGLLNKIVPPPPSLPSPSVGRRGGRDTSKNQVSSILILCIGTPFFRTIVGATLRRPPEAYTGKKNSGRGKLAPTEDSGIAHQKKAYYRRRRGVPTLQTVSWVERSTFTVPGWRAPGPDRAYMGTKIILGCRARAGL